MGEVFQGVGGFIHGIKVTQANCQSSRVRCIILHLWGQVVKKSKRVGAVEELYLCCRGGNKVVVQENAGPHIGLAPEDEDGPGPLPGVGHFSCTRLKARLSCLVVHPGEGR